VDNERLVGTDIVIWEFNRLQQRAETFFHAMPLAGSARCCDTISVEKGYQTVDFRLVPLLKRMWSYRREAAGTVAYWSGIGRAYELAARPVGAIILVYHSIAKDDVAEFIDPLNRLSPQVFELQMAFLSAHRRVVPLSQVVEQVVGGTSPVAGTVCITLDDGYLDNLTTAAPILQKYRLPATVFLATGYVGRGETQWADTLYWLFKWRTVHRLTLASIGLKCSNLRSASERVAAWRQLHRHLLESEYHERVRLLDEVRAQLGPVGHSPPRLTMNWDDVRQLTRRYSFLEIGGHTRDHIDLRTHVGESAALQIKGCADDIQRELGSIPKHFSFPYARWCAQTREMVSAAGWRSAVVVGDRVRVSATTDRFAIPRVEAPYNMTELRFKTSGAYPGALAIAGLK
jgi:peptidoglycan/xylan/chitin deacetylase (PgdA/CDA1 family)